MSYVKKDNLGEMGVHLYRLDGKVHAVECSVEEYDSLALPDAGAPKLPDGAEWIQSIKRPKFDTPDGTLGEGEYGTDGKGICWIRPVGGTEVLAKEEDIVNDEPNEKAVSDITRQSLTTKTMIEIEKG